MYYKYRYPTISNIGPGATIKRERKTPLHSTLITRFTDGWKIWILNRNNSPPFAHTETSDFTGAGYLNRKKTILIFQVAPHSVAQRFGKDLSCFCWYSSRVESIIAKVEKKQNWKKKTHHRTTCWNCLSTPWQLDSITVFAADNNSIH